MLTCFTFSCAFTTFSLRFLISNSHTALLVSDAHWPFITKRNCFCLLFFFFFVVLGVSSRGKTFNHSPESGCRCRNEVARWTSRSGEERRGRDVTGRSPRETRISAAGISSEKVAKTWKLSKTNWNSEHARRFSFASSLSSKSDCLSFWNRKLVLQNRMANVKNLKIFHLRSLSKCRWENFYRLETYFLITPIDFSFWWVSWGDSTAVKVASHNQFERTGYFERGELFSCSMRFQY